jgi:type IV pilus biogenesis/stability protein PilW
VGVVKQKILIGISLCSLLVLTGCVSEQSYVGSDKPVSDRTFDNIEAARTRISLGLNYLRRGDTSQAKYNLERARSFAPNSAEVYSALAYYYQNVGENKQAEEYFRTAISKDNNYADAYNNFGAFLCQIQRYEEAEQLLLKAISRPGYIRVAESYENLSLCQLQQGHFSKTRDYLDNSISHNTTRISSLTLAAGLAYAMGDNRQAKNLLDRIQRLGRVSARTVLLSYLIADKNGDRETMRNAEQLLLTLYTETAETRLLLQGKLDESEFEQLRERYKDSLMANIVLPDQDAVKPELPAKPVANPKLKVVKRKTADEEAAERQAQTSKSITVVPKTEPAKLKNTASAIVSSLGSNGSAETIVKQAVVPAALPVETRLADNPPQQQGSMTDQQSPAQTAAGTTATTAAAVANLPSRDSLAAYTAANPTPSAVEQNATTTIASQSTAQTPEPAQPDPDLTASADATQSAAAGTATPFHVVQDAESLYSISLQHNIRLQRLMDWNQLTPDSVIRTGQKIWLGAVTAAELAQSAIAESAIANREQVSASQPYHVVSAGETIFGISYRYNVRLSSFMSWNNFTDSSKLKVGQQVYIIDPASITQ